MTLRIVLAAALFAAMLFVTRATPAADYAAVLPRLETAIREQMDRHAIRGLAVALIDDQRTVHAAGYGSAKRDSIFRCGSISKLFNAVAVVQLVEQGKLDLDAPICRYDPRLAIVVPFEGAGPITLRQLLCHRSGMIRESPVGGYLDGSQPTLAETVTSVRSCVLVNPPNTKTRYSNVGPTLAGQAVATAAGIPYEQYQNQRVLGPQGMTSSSFLLKDVPRERLAAGFMRIADGRGGFTHSEAPLFDLGTMPAGNLFTTADDLARFVSMLAADGRAGGKTILSPASLAAMCTPQLVKDDSGFGLGFRVGKFRAHKSVAHMGAVYGHTSSLAFLPGPKIGVVVLSSEDIVTAPVKKVTDLALSLMLEAKLDEKPPAGPAPVTLAPEALAPLVGQYESASSWATIEAAGTRLTGDISGQPITLTPVGPLEFLADGRIYDAVRTTFRRDASGKVAGFTLGDQKFTRVGQKTAPEAPPLWAEYAGSYGPEFIPLVVSVRHGHLYAMTENEQDYRLTPINRNVFALPPGMYADEHVVFLTGPDGRVHAVNMANMVLRRR